MPKCSAQRRATWLPIRVRSTAPMSTRSGSSGPHCVTATSCRSASSGSSSSSVPMPEVSEATYLSIGEVLGLLLEQFPDITISKIRFLESQGLISPERTASGYRKFYEDDVELLKVILTEQRRNYLPLRVIKDRLDSGQIDPTGEHGRPNGDEADADGTDVAGTESGHRG